MFQSLLSVLRTFWTSNAILALPSYSILVPNTLKTFQTPPDMPLDCDFLTFLSTLGHIQEFLCFRTSEYSKYFNNCLQNTWRLTMRMTLPFNPSLSHASPFVKEALKSWVSIDCFLETPTLLLVAPITLLPLLVSYFPHSYTFQISPFSVCIACPCPHFLSLSPFIVSLPFPCFYFAVFLPLLLLFPSLYQVHPSNHVSPFPPLPFL